MNCIATIREVRKQGEGAMTEKTIRVTTDTVQEAIEQYVKDRAENRFTTADIARFMGVDEYPVRAAVSWLARYELIEIVPGVRSKRYLGDPENPQKRRHTDSYSASVYRLRVAAAVDFTALNRAFGFA